MSIETYKNMFANCRLLTEEEEKEAIREMRRDNIKNEIQSLIKTLKATGGWVKRGNGEGWFNHEILEDALALINSQEQRIKELTEEKEDLKAQCRYTTEAFHSVRADTVREMQERFIAEIEQTPNANEHFIKAWKSKIDQISKEMLEGEK